MHSKIVVGLLLSLFISQFVIEAYSKRVRPLVWDMNELEQMKVEARQSKQAKQIIEKAEKYYHTEPISVVDKKHTFAPDNHYYCSTSIYWWPNPNNPQGPYQHKDGIINPDSYNYDYTRLYALSKRSEYLSKAFYLTEDERYYIAFVKQMQTWFLNEKTLMYPNFTYSQVVPGYRENRGKSSGMIDAYVFNSVIESIRLVNSVKLIDRKTMKGLQKWFLGFVEWSENTYGETMKEGKQNISLAYDVTLVNMYLFAGESKKAKNIVDGFSERRLHVQIKEDGSQPGELTRTRAIFYSLYNLTHVIDFCFLSRVFYDDYYEKNKECINLAYDFVKKHINNPSDCPYSQITGWDECWKMYDSLIERRESLTTH